MSNSSHEVTQTSIALPHFGAEVPLLVDAEGYHWVPLARLCQLVHLNPTRCLLHVRHRMLWSSARLLPLALPHRHRSVLAWCLPFPLGAGYFLSTLWQSARTLDDPILYQALKTTTEELTSYADEAMRRVMQDYDEGRKLVYHLGVHLARYQRIFATLSDQSRRWTNDQRQIFASIQQDLSPILVSAGSFVRQWIGDAKDQPVVDAIRVDSEGNIVDAQVPVALFGTFSYEDRRRVYHYYQDLNSVTDRLEEFLQSLGWDPSSLDDLDTFADSDDSGKPGNPEPGGQ